MTLSGIMTAAALVCFLSFAWGMAIHFRRVGQSSPAMFATGAIAVISAILETANFCRRRFLFPDVAVVLYGMSAMLFWSAVVVTRGKMAACGQGVVSRCLVKQGPYRYIRHPFYTAYNLAWLAGFMASGWWAAAIVAVVMAVIYECFARTEERAFLCTPLAQAYNEYKQQAGRYLPRLRGS